MKITRNLWLLIFLSTVCLVKSDCSTNCSSCGTKDGANYCFVCEGSTWKDGSCSGSAPSGCKYHSAVGCLACIDGNSLSRDDYTCMAVSGASLIKDCLVQWNTKVNGVVV